MTITICRSTGRTTTAILRSLDSEQRRLVVSAPWDEPAVVTLTKVRDQLTEQEETELRQVLGLDRPPESA